MKRFRRWFIIAILIAWSLACLAFLFVNVNRGIMLPQATAQPTLETVDLRGQYEEISKELLGVPWQGLRFLCIHRRIIMAILIMGPRRGWRGILLASYY